MEYKKKKRPFVYLCTGMSLDGKISTAKRIDTRITADDGGNFWYDLRVPCDAIIVGGRTALIDDPSLVVKSVKRQNQRLKLGKTKEPVKVAIVSDITKLKTNGDFFNTGDTRKIIFTTERLPKRKIEEVKQISDVFILGKKKVNLMSALVKRYDLGIKSVIVEGGGELIFSLLKE